MNAVCDTLTHVINIHIHIPYTYLRVTYLARVMTSNTLGTDPKNCSAHCPMSTPSHAAVSEILGQLVRQSRQSC